MFKLFFVVAVTACMLFLSCKENEPLVNNRPAVVEVIVYNLKGEPLQQKSVGMYDEASYKAFEEDYTVKPVMKVVTDEKGVATFTLEYERWFANTVSREMMFVVEEVSSNNYRRWSRGGTVTVGKNHTFKIEIDELLNGSDEDDPVLPGSQVVLSSIEIVQLPMQTTYPLHAASINLEGLILEGVYSDGSRKELPVSEVQVSGFSTDVETEECRVVLTVEDKQVSFTVRVINAVIEEGVLTQIIENQGAVYQVPEEVKVIGSRVFAGCSFDKVILPEGVVEVQAHSFDGSLMREIVCPASLKQIGEYAFARCAGLKMIDLSCTQLQMIPENAFQDAAISEIQFPASLKTIADQSFLRTTSLKEVTLPVSLETIGQEAFRESGLSKVVLPHGIRLVSSRAFYLCGNLNEVDCHGIAEEGMQGSMESGAFQECMNLSKIVFPESLVTLGTTLFSGSVQLQSITLGKNLQSLKFNSLGNAIVNVLTVHAEIPPVLDVYSLPKEVKEAVYVPAASLEAYKQADRWKLLEGKMK